MTNYEYMPDEKKSTGRQKKKNTATLNFPVTNIGSVTLLMIFIVVCMVSFAALSLSTASTDYKAAKKSARHITDYYEASNDAEEKLATIQGMIQSAYDGSDSEESYYSTLRELMEADTTFSISDSIPDSTSDSSDDGTSDSIDTNVADNTSNSTSDTGSLITYTEAAKTFSYQCKINENQALEVELTLSYDTDTDVSNLYRITSWKTISTTEWQGDNSIKLIGE